MAIFLIFSTFLICWLALDLVKRNDVLFIAAASLGVFYSLANRSLISESHKVLLALDTQGLEAARKQLSFIVGRETKNLNEEEIENSGN